ncbi:hypothetical protein GCM10023310_04800 [Paenibacillus vulneris]|uniref:Uncharacterized protein n=1 Tax=Paenibacillus vulneris TaxID=1133364 RepID=A0ABW3UMT5_9BACL
MWEHPSNTQIKKIKERYNTLYTQLEPIVNAWDPIGLIADGAPSDEYDCITVQLISLLDQGKNEDEIFEFIIHELDDHFGMGISSLKDGMIKARFTKEHREFSLNLVKWYSEIVESGLN